MKTLKNIAIVAASDAGIILGQKIARAFDVSGEDITTALFSSRKAEGVKMVPSLKGFVQEAFEEWDAFIFIGALGICVRSIASVLKEKTTDPAVINCDAAGHYVQSVLSGHAGGANELCRRVSRILGASPVITTSSDVQQLWPLDTIGREAGWTVEPCSTSSVPSAIARYINHRPTALLLEVRDRITDLLEQTKAPFVEIFYSYEAIDFSRFELFLAVTPKLYDSPVPALFYRPKVLCVGAGCNKNIDADRFAASFEEVFQQQGLSMASISSLGSVEFKLAEPAFMQLAAKLQVPLRGFTAEELNRVNTVPSPSETVMQKVGVASVAEASSALLAGESRWVVEKQTVALAGISETEAKFYTFAVSMDGAARRDGRIAIVGAGPGNPELITLRGRRYLETADLVLYAGSLVPEKLTHAAKAGATVRSSAGMALEEQLDLMTSFYRQGKFVVRLHTGDPSIYGAIQEQISFFEAEGMRYEIVPGVSSFQAAAAALRSEFTVPEKVQTIILTRGEGRTPVPEKERLSELARTRSTMCIYLSGDIADRVQQELLEHYPHETPVAVCYRLTWDDQQIMTGMLDNLASLVNEMGKTRTVLLVVGEAIGARVNRSKLYDPAFAHGFRVAEARKESEP